MSKKKKYGDIFESYEEMLAEVHSLTAALAAKERELAEAHRKIRKARAALHEIQHFDDYESPYDDPGQCATIALEEMANKPAPAGEEGGGK